MPAGWDNFFYLVGSAAGGLIGLLFVVVTLTAGRRQTHGQSRGQILYLTPTVLHFAIVLSVSAMALMPALGARTRGFLVAAPALVGLVNAGIACWGLRGRGRSAPTIHWTDFWMYGAAPVALYLALAGAAAALWAGMAFAVHAIGAALLALVLLGIRNAWDLLTWIAPGRRAGEASGSADGLGAVADAEEHHGRGAHR